MNQRVIWRWFDLQEYIVMWDAMRAFTEARDASTDDEIWFLQHPAVFTQGQNGKPEHVLHANRIPLQHTDRGGQVTYHAPGQLMIYVLVDLKRKNLNVRDLVSCLEQSLILFLHDQHITAHAKREAPGIYINDQKIASIGLRIRKGCSYHGLAFNVNMDLTPFSWINPCGFPMLKMTQLHDHISALNLPDLCQQLVPYLQTKLGYTEALFIN